MGFISTFLRSILDAIYAWIPNYGWAVILFTLLIRFVLLPLDIKSKKSMSRMTKVQPQIDALNKKYAKDKEKLNQKMAELYKKEKINPLSGCLPLLIQLPILFAMFGVMREVANEETVKMLLSMMNGEAPIFQDWLWIKNVFQPDSFLATIIPSIGDTLAGIGAVEGNAILSQANLDAVRAFLTSEQYVALAAEYGASQMWYTGQLLMWQITIPMQINGWFLLPVLAAASQFLSSKLMPTNTASASSAKPNSTNQFMTWFFPLFSLWICASSNAGFALYWVAVNLIQIVQQFALQKYFDWKDRKQAALEEGDQRS